MAQLSSVIGPTSNDTSTSVCFRSEENKEEYKLKWAAIERLPTFERLRTALYDQLENTEGGNREEKKVVDVSKLNATERKFLIPKLIKHITEDNLKLLTKLRERMDRVNVKLPTIEVRYSNLSVEAKCEVVKGKPLPTLWNSFLTSITRITGINTSEAKIDILRDVSGIIKPSRITLLLGPPGCGKTTFLQALSGNPDKALKVTGEISYNGYRLNEFVPERTASYISQYDVHLAEMTVRETVDFAARFQGVGNRADILQEVLRREKQQQITPDADLDAYMKAISVEGQPKNLQTEYILKIMGLDICADTMIGDVMRGGISGGEKKRLTAAEMIVGPSKALFIDELSTGLDSSTTYQIVACLQQMAHTTESTVVVSLLQPAPETYDLFDDVILMAEGKIVYHGPQKQILSFFKECGFKCPERKGAADFLQEVLSQKDQEQYWSCQHEKYAYITVDQLVEKFKSSQVGQNLSNELSRPFDKSENQEIALSFNKYSLSNWEIFKACLSREILLMKRNSFIYIFKSIQLGLIAIIAATVFLRTRMEIDERHASYYVGALFYALILTMVNGFPEVVMMLARIHVFYKQRDCNFYPSWAYAIPAALLKIPISMIESITWTCITYFLIGYSPEAPRFFKQLLVLFFLHTMSLSMLRFVASYFQAMTSSFIGASLLIMVFVLFGGFLVPKPSLPNWLEWAFWISPLSYTELGLTLNEFLSPRWQKMSHYNITLGREVLVSHGLNYSSHMYWISIAAVIGFIILFNIGFISWLAFLNSKGTAKPTISREQLQEKQCKLSDAGKEKTAIAPTKDTPLKKTGKRLFWFQIS